MVFQQITIMPMPQAPRKNADSPKLGLSATEIVSKSGAHHARKTLAHLAAKGSGSDICVGHKIRHEAAIRALEQAD